MPDIWLPEFERVPDDEFLAGKLRRQPVGGGVIMHSGKSGPYPGTYAENEPDGRQVSYHFAPVKEHPEHLVQMVPINRRAWHAGKAGNDYIGICLPGPWDKDPREPWEHLEVVRVVICLQIAGYVPAWWCRHSDIKTTRTDPGPGFQADWMLAVGIPWGLPRG